MKILCSHICILGRVLNRFSKDIGFMDDILPFQFLELFTVSFIPTVIIYW